jgi:hypothetical protein
VKNLGRDKAIVWILDFWLRHHEPNTAARGFGIEAARFKTFRKSRALLQRFLFALMSGFYHAPFFVSCFFLFSSLNDAVVILPFYLLPHQFFAAAAAAVLDPCSEGGNHHQPTILFFVFFFFFFSSFEKTTKCNDGGPWRPFTVQL